MRLFKPLVSSCMAFAVFLIQNNIDAQSIAHPSTEILDRIKAVENRLGGWVKIKDSAGWNILDRMQYYKINGISIAVIHNYKIEWSKAYGWADTARHIAATTNTLFQAASVGKSIHAVATMLLAQSGKLNLDRDINAYLREWTFPYDTASHGKKITTRLILGHMAGLSVNGFDGYCIGQPLPTIVQILNGQPPANNQPVRSEMEPGTRFQYSGGGYMISGLIDEELSGRRYPDYVRQALFVPFRMSHSFYTSQLTDVQDGLLATGYRWDGKSIGCRYHVYPEEACAGLWTTPTDLARFILELQQTLSGRDRSILSSDSVRALLTPQSDAGNALGFFIEKKGDRNYFHHDGLNEGFVSDYYGSFTGGDGVVIMANSDFASYIDITEEVINSVASVYDWLGFYTPVLKTEVAVAHSVLNDYVGKYRFRDDGDQYVDIYWKDGKLWFHDTGSPIPWLMHFTTNKDCFFYEVFQNNHEFTRDANGRVDGFIIHASDGSFKVKKVK